MKSSKFLISTFNTVVLLIVFLIPFSAQAETIDAVVQQTIAEFNDGSDFKYLSIIHKGNSFILKSSNNKKLEEELYTLTQKKLRLNGSFDKTGSIFNVESFEKLPEVAYATKVLKTAGLNKQYKLATILVNFPNKTHSCKTWDNINNLLYGKTNSVISHLEYSSRGAASLNSDTNNNGNNDIFGPFIIEPNNNSCNVSLDNTQFNSEAERTTALRQQRILQENSWTKEVNQQVSNSGISLAQYDIVTYIFPDSLGCGAGNAIIDCTDQGGATCLQRIYDCRLDLLVHELGHNIGFPHTGIDVDNNGEFETVAEKTADGSSPMGYTSTGHTLSMHNAHFQLQEGWLSESQGTAKVVNQSGVYYLLNLEREFLTGTLPLVLEIKTKSGSPYFLSLRSDLGEYNSIPGVYRNKLNIHRHDLHSTNSSRIIKVLDKNGVFRDNKENITIEVQDISNSLTRVSIKLSDEVTTSNSTTSNTSSSQTNPSLTLISTVSTTRPQTTAVATIKTCVDRDNDGWGWDGEKQCRSYSYFNPNTCVDFDGDGWGWDGTKSCLSK